MSPTGYAHNSANRRTIGWLSTAERPAESAISPRSTYSPHSPFRSRHPPLIRLRAWLVRGTAPIALCHSSSDGRRPPADPHPLGQPSGRVLRPSTRRTAASSVDSTASNSGAMHRGSTVPALSFGGSDRLDGVARARYSSCRALAAAVQPRGRAVDPATSSRRCTVSFHRQKTPRPFHSGCRSQATTAASKQVPAPYRRIFMSSGSVPTGLFVVGSMAMRSFLLIGTTSWNGLHLAASHKCVFQISSSQVCRRRIPASLDPSTNKATRTSWLTARCSRIECRRAAKRRRR